VLSAELEAAVPLPWTPVRGAVRYVLGVDTEIAVVVP
jgi:hypothetical protein